MSPVMNQVAKHFHLTADGVALIKRELEDLKRQRLTIAERLKEAKELGDLSENSDYSTAQDEFKYVESRIDEIEHILSNLQIIKNPKDPQEVMLGTTVELSNSGKKAKYHIVGSLEANPAKQKISNESPIGKALMGKRIGESVDIVTPNGDHTYKIAKIS